MKISVSSVITLGICDIGGNIDRCEIDGKLAASALRAGNIGGKIDRCEIDGKLG